MNEHTIVGAILLGLLEGLTEFIPVSSTGHILLAGHFLDFRSTGRSFEVLIQLGAILALLTVYFFRLWSLARSLPTSSEARRFVFAVAAAFLPAAIIGVIAYDIIKTVLFETPLLICTTLLIGGIVLIYVDRLKLTPLYEEAQSVPIRVAIVIGFFQCLAMIPGVSRSGATIVGAMLMGSSKRASAEFSFFLAMPTMAGAFTFDLFKNRDLLTGEDFQLIVIGFLAAFVSAAIVVRSLLAFVSKHGFAVFGWWRVAVALFGFAGLYWYG